MNPDTTIGRHAQALSRRHHDTVQNGARRGRRTALAIPPGAFREAALEAAAEQLRAELSLYARRHVDVYLRAGGGDSSDLPPTLTRTRVQPERVNPGTWMLRPDPAEKSRSCHFATACGSRGRDCVAAP